MLRRYPIARFYSTYSYTQDIISHLNPFFITGLTDAQMPTLKKVKKFNFKTKNDSFALELWGTNLRSLIGYGKLTKQVRDMFVIPYYQKSVIIGLLLSDGWLTYASKTNKNARLGFKQSLYHYSYALFVFNQLFHYCNSMPHLTTGIRKGKTFYGLEFFTRSLPCFTELHSLFYHNGVKVIPEKIFDLLTPEALAHWIMGDGQARPYGLVLCTDSYSVKDVVKLINVLIIKYRLECAIRVHKENQISYLY